MHIPRKGQKFATVTVWISNNVVIEVFFVKIKT